MALQASLSGCKEACGGAINSTIPGSDPSDPRGVAPPPRVSLVRKRPDEDSEIDIFGAEKYFGFGEYASPICIDPRAAAPVSKSRSSTWSEMCSGNSRGGLLRPRQRTPLHQLGGLICCYSCSRNRDAIVVHKANGGEMNSYELDQNDFGTGSWRIRTASQMGQWQWPSKNCNGKSSKEDALDTNRISESSSDLFEIDSVCFGRGSIDWSMVTASAANVSVASDRSGEIGGHREKPQQGPRPRSRATAGLLFGGCSSQKAVRVASSRARRDQSAGGRGGAAEVHISSAPSARYHLDPDAVGGTGRVLPLRIARVSLQSPRTAR
ncbi:hypothetical protein HPP92_017915 [Vanilla planifolia]|uniref:Uncharacterized protein n=1 Tax=Vanilla planifolia TaxID=51239 RepID=A0A835QGE8_VANPL|nr:hypothetical protein HPP92_017915 [Vanilla planifolia]